MQCLTWIKKCRIPVGEFLHIPSFSSMLKKGILPYLLFNAKKGILPYFILPYLSLSYLTRMELISLFFEEKKKKSFEGSSFMWKESFRLFYTSHSLQTFLKATCSSSKYLRFWQISFHSFKYKPTSQPGVGILPIVLQAIIIVVVVYITASFFAVFCSQFLNKARMFFSFNSM